MQTWKVKNDNGYTTSGYNIPETFDISGETLEEAVSSNAEEILRHTKPEKDRIISVEDIKIKWSDGIFGGGGGAVAEITAKISNNYTPDSPEYRENYKVYSAWIYADKEDAEYSIDIKQLRKRAGMTQREFAEYFRLSPRSLENWEYGRTNPTPSCIVDLMEYKLKNEGIIK